MCRPRSGRIATVWHGICNQSTIERARLRSICHSNQRARRAVGSGHPAGDLRLGMPKSPFVEMACRAVPGSRPCETCLACSGFSCIGRATGMGLGPAAVVLYLGACIQISAKGECLRCFAQHGEDEALGLPIVEARRPTMACRQRGS